jgi:hypothetical protein
MFFYSLPIFFNDIKLVSPIEFLLMMAAMFIVFYVSVPKPEQGWQPQAYDNYLLAAWLGGISLFWVFWPYFLFINASLFGADLLAKSGKITVSTWDEIHFILLLTIIWWAISVWHCSINTNARVWSALARLTIVAVLIEYAIKMIIRVDYPRIFFDCEEILLDYGSCF